MASRDQRSAAPARAAQVSRRQAQQARAQLAVAGLSHQEQRRLRAILRDRDTIVRRRRIRIRRVSLVSAAAIIAAAIAALSFGLAPAMEAALGDGTTGSFVVSHQVCSSKTGCQWVGTFQARGQFIVGLAYGGSLPPGDGPGSVIPARYPGSSDQVFALRGSHTWVFDLLVTLAIGAIAGAAVWISPLGTGPRGPAGVRDPAGIHSG